MNAYHEWEITPYIKLRLNEAWPGPMLEATPDHDGSSEHTLTLATVRELRDACNAALYLRQARARP